MDLNSILQVEFYPKINEQLLNDSLSVIKKNQEKWPFPFFKNTHSYLNFEKIENIVNRFRNEMLENIIVLGTGGSIQTLLALKHLAKKSIIPITSSRAIELKKCLDSTRPEDSLVIPISRGGETLDINSTIGTFVSKGYKFLGLSSRGMMHEILQDLNCLIMDVPNLSGRFAGSNTNVGIVPAFIAGIKIHDFLKGLEQGYQQFMGETITNNWALELATYLYNLYLKGYRVIFSMPYSKSLEGLVGLFVQELSESTGKEGKGLMGAFHSAPLCQHSVLEFLLGGSKGIVLPILWTVVNETNDVVLESSIDYIQGKHAQEIVNYQADATFQALLEEYVPSVKIELTKPLEFNMGVAIALIQASIYYLCLLLDVNWSDNPKVNIGKKICNEALKRGLSRKERKQKRENIARVKFKNYFS
ncbi:MAG: hypothetical protein ACTSXH_07740 [Promethearchaeota archaeon]